MASTNFWESGFLATLSATPRYSQYFLHFACPVHADCQHGLMSVGAYHASVLGHPFLMYRNPEVFVFRIQMMPLSLGRGAVRGTPGSLVLVFAGMDSATLLEMAERPGGQNRTSHVPSRYLYRFCFLSVPKASILRLPSYLCFLDVRGGLVPALLFIGPTTLRGRSIAWRQI